MGRNIVKDITSTRNRSGQLVVSATFSKNLEDRLLKRATALGLTLDEFMHKQFLMLAGWKIDDEGNGSEIKRECLIQDPIATQETEEGRTSFFHCPHCLNKVKKKLKDYGGEDIEGLFTMKQFLDEHSDPTIASYCKPLSSMPQSLIAIIGVSDRGLKADVRKGGLNYYTRAKLQAVVNPVLAEIRDYVRSEKAKAV